MLLLLRQALFRDLDVSFSGLESFYPSLAVVDRSSRGPDVEELQDCQLSPSGNHSKTEISTCLDKILKLLEELLLLAISVGKSLFVVSLELVPVKWRQMPGCARRSLSGFLQAVDALFGIARFWRLDLETSALRPGKCTWSICHVDVGKHRFRRTVSGRLRLCKWKNG